MSCGGSEAKGCTCRAACLVVPQEITPIGDLSGACVTCANKPEARQVAAEVPRVRIGCRCLYDRRDIERWLERHKVGSFTETPSRASTGFGSVLMGSVTIDPLARRIAQRLRARLPDSFDG
jgi:hypothetical protein